MGLRDSRSTRRPLMTPVRCCPAPRVGHADQAPTARPNVSIRTARGRRTLPAMGRVTRWDVSLGIVRPGGMLGKAAAPSRVVALLGQPCCRRPALAVHAGWVLTPFRGWLITCREWCQPLTVRAL